MPSPEDSNPFLDELNRRPAGVAFGNPFEDELQNRKGPPSAGYVFQENLINSALNNVMAIPSAGGNVAATAINAGKAVVGRAARAGINNWRRLVGMPVYETPTIGERYAEASQNEGPVQDLLRSIPRPDMEDATALVESVPSLMPGGESPSDAMARNRLEFQEEDRRMREAHPIAAESGDIGGDIASLFIGRRATGADQLVQKAETRLAGRAINHAAESLAGDVGKILRGPAMQKLARGGTRSLEAGAEAAVLDVLNDPNADPVETAALAAGGQLVGSGFLGASQGLLTGGGVKGAALNLTVAAISTMGLVQMLKTATPGGQDRILESVETGYGKVALMLGLGAASAAIGATRYGRGNTNLSAQTRAYLDGLATVHRGTLLSVLSDWTEGDEQHRSTIESVLNGLAQNPSYEGGTPEEQAIVQRLRTGAEAKPETYKSGEGF